MYPIVNPMMMTGAGPLMSSYPAYGYGGMWEECTIDGEEVEGGVTVLVTVLQAHSTPTLTLT